MNEIHLIEGNVDGIFVGPTQSYIPVQLYRAKKRKVSIK